MKALSPQHEGHELVTVRTSASILSLSFIISRLMRWVPALCKNVARTKWRSPQGPSSIWTMHDANAIHHAQIFVDICPCSSTCMALVLGYLTCLSNNGETVWSIALHCICFYLLVKEKLLKLAIKVTKQQQTGSMPFRISTHKLYLSNNILVQGTFYLLNSSLFNAAY